MAHDTLPPPPVNLSVPRQADHYGVYHGGARGTSKADVPMSHLISVIKTLAQLYSELKCYCPKIKGRAAVSVVGRQHWKRISVETGSLPLDIRYRTQTASTSQKSLFYSNIPIPFPRTSA